jgi:hypothetical protein
MAGASRQSQVSGRELQQQTKDGSGEMGEKITTNGNLLNIEPRTLNIKPY